ncbi:histone-like nucleoid-structuring protein Lsr2 [Microbacterium oleivorans]|uniref:Lsr2 family DNA-binding protein n=1 Tax=Microbacterium oleivorans TaxID=273677 RepID=UPI00342A29A0
MTSRRLEHGTPEGYNRGCTQHDRCPALPVHGLTCYTAHTRFVSSERRYMSGYDRHLPAAAIARLLGLTPLRPTSPLAGADSVPIAGPAADVEAQIEAYAAAKAERERAALAASARTSEKTPAVCPECVAGKHGNCDGTAWDLAEDQPTTCSCTHPENAPDNQEQTMPKRKTEPTSTPATKPEPATGSNFEAFPKPKPFDGSGRTKAERAEIRAWAEANGWTIGTTGRIPRDVIAAYDAAKTGETTPAPAASPTPDNEEVGEYVYAEASDALDETRERIGDLNPTDLTADGAIVPTIETRPEWAEVAISDDVERARDLAARLEAENAILLEQLHTTGVALEIALRSWAAADDKLATERVQAAGASTIRRAANRHLLEKIHQLEIDLGAANTETEILKASASAGAQRIAELEAEIERLSARRWWQR